MLPYILFSWPLLSLLSTKLSQCPRGQSLCLFFIYPHILVVLFHPVILNSICMPKTLKFRLLDQTFPQTSVILPTASSTLLLGWASWVWHVTNLIPGFLVSLQSSPSIKCDVIIPIAQIRQEESASHSFPFLLKPQTQSQQILLVLVSKYV